MKSPTRNDEIMELPNDIRAGNPPISAKRASLARALAQYLHPFTQVEAFTAGLLQDMAPRSSSP